MIKDKVALTQKSDLINLLGGSSLIVMEIKSPFDIINLSNRGLKKASLDALIGHLGMSKRSFTEKILNISVKTMERKKSDDLLDKRTSSYIIEVAKVVEHAFEVFENEEKVQHWLNAPNKTLNQMKPIDLFEMPTGLDLVNSVLGRIEEGVYS